MHKLRILPAAQILDALRRNLASCSGTAFRRAQDSMTRGALALTSYGPCLLRFGRRLGRTPVLALTLEQLREQFHRKYLSAAEASKIQMQSTVQDAIVGQPLHGKHAIFDMCFLCVNVSSA